METTYEDAAIIGDLELIEGRYAVKDRAEVLAYLQAHPDLVPLLLEASTQLQAYFPDARLSIERIRDPEEPIEQLFVAVTASPPFEEARGRLRQFDDGWWLNNRVRARGKLCIDVEF